MTNKQRNSYLVHKYGMTLKQYNQQLRAQNHCCALCGKHKSHSKTSLAVDHNHKTGKIRGIVCYRCNKFIIGRHDTASATKLYLYMIKFEGDI
jgi:hypothetical protein